MSLRNETPADYQGPAETKREKRTAPPIKDYIPPASQPLTEADRRAGYAAFAKIRKTLGMRPMSDEVAERILK